jgi:2,3-dihydroxybenzoate decarboxylase
LYRIADQEAAASREVALTSVRKIALEEHFLAPGFEEYWLKTVEDVDPSLLGAVLSRLNDFGELRLEAMDKAGIGRSVLGLAGPGVQIERDVAKATRKAIEANDFLAKQVARNPARYSGFAHIALQDPMAAADELERCMKQLGFAGCMINGHTNGQYLDDPKLYPFWERAEALGAVVYLHPADPVSPFTALNGTKGLKRATWEWTLETGSHALRLVFGGLFDRFPKATLALGHLGETLPYLLWRFDSRAKLYGIKLQRQPSDYIRENMVVTLSGMFSAEPLNCAIAALGVERVMFSADYPFESSEEAGLFMDTVPLDEQVRERVASVNAKKLLRLPN